MASEEPKVTVIIPFFNRPAFCKEAIASVLVQGYRNFEIIIIDDGSYDTLDRTFDVGTDERIRYMRQDHLGVSSARNLGIANASGKYVAFLDDDDRFLPQKLRIQVKTMEDNPACAMSYSHALVMDEKGALLKERKWGGNLAGNIYPEMLFIKNSFITIPTVMVRSDILKESGGFDIEMKVCEDLDLWRRIAKDRCVLHIQNDLAVIREHSRKNASIGDRAKARAKYYQKALDGDKTLGKPFKAKLRAEMYSFYGLEGLMNGQYMLGAKLISSAFKNSASFSFCYLMIVALSKIKAAVKLALYRGLPAPAYDKVLRTWRIIMRRSGGGTETGGSNV